MRLLHSLFAVYAFPVAAALLAGACADRAAPVAPVGVVAGLTRPNPLLVPERTDLVQVSAGFQSACALRDDGAVECWGRNAHGETPPFRAASVGSFTQVSVGGFHACAVRNDGAVECWGDNLDGRAPGVKMPATGRFAQVEVGLTHTCALRSDGVVECWGDNSDGEAPAIKTAAVGTFTQVTSALSSSCAVRSDGVVECWGSDGAVRAPAIKTAASGSFTQVSLSGASGCALRTDGAVECWGDDVKGQAPAVRSATSGVFIRVAAGVFHTCALRSDGAIECWGDNADGKAPPVRTAAAGTFVQLDAGDYRTCAVRSDHGVECWGDDGAELIPPGMHVLPTATFAASPTQVNVGDLFTLSLANAQVPGHPEATSFTYAFDCGDPSGYTAATPSASASCVAAGAGTLAVRGKVIDQDGDFAEYSASVTVTQIAQTITFTSQPPSPAVLKGTYNLSATGGASGNLVVFSSLTPSTCTVSGGTVSLNAVGSCIIAANQAGNAAYSAAPQVTQSFAVVYGFVGFSQPVDNLPTVNTANSGQAIPLKWRAVDATGAPVTNLTTVTVTVTSLPCSIGSTPDQLEEYATGASGLQNLGNGYYQFNWKTPKTYAKSCKTMHLDLGDGAAHDALFNFTK